MRHTQPLRPVWAGEPAPPAGARALQPALDELGTPLHDVTFVVVVL